MADDISVAMHHQAPTPPRPATARDLMEQTYLTIRVDQTVRDAVTLLGAAPPDSPVAGALIVTDDDGRYVGLLTPRLLFKSTLSAWSPADEPRQDPASLERELFAVAQDRLTLCVGEIVVPGLPTAAPDDRLMRMIECVCAKRLEYLPVVEAEKPIGVVGLKRLFQRAVALALAPGDEGIQYGSRRRT